MIFGYFNYMFICGSLTVFQSICLHSRGINEYLLRGLVDATCDGELKHLEAVKDLFNNI